MLKTAEIRTPSSGAAKKAKRGRHAHIVERGGISGERS